MQWCSAVCGVGLLLVAATVEPAVYRWVDEQGQVHYSDQPRDERAARHQFAPGSVGESARRSRAAEVEAGEQAAIERCQTARDQLKQYTDAARLIERSVTGQERELSAEERNRLTDQARADVADACEEAE